MKKAAENMKDKIENTNFLKPKPNIISNVTANFEGNLDRIKELLIKQVYSRVRWRESVIKSTEENLKDIVEIGSGKVLSGMNKRIRKDLEIKSISNLGEIDSFFKTYKEIL